MPKLIDEPAAPAGKWHVGETRTLFTTKMERPLTITRTTRDFAYDWVDAANEADRGALEAKGLAWVAHPDGYTQLRSVRHLADRERALLSGRTVPNWRRPELEPA